MSKKPIVRCAIYTRKSTEEGLDMEYNTLDAQRDAGEKYIGAMQHEGWRVIPDLYDDGGYSGGNLERPALRRLIEDIKQRKIDIVIVYKIDRLSRSLVDFAKLMEVFDQYGTSFVSVTQHFNTKDSMGRLTMNILLSFAQFEREVTGERIRDKFAASKKKGLWMGGPPPLGYDVENRKLIINKEEAKTVKHIFERFLALKSKILLAKELNANGFVTKRYISQTGNKNGGGRFSVNNLTTILANHLYIGQVHHHSEYFQGEHQAIISEEIFEQAQALKREPFSKKAKRTHLAKSNSLLRGIIFCSCCNGAMSPTYTNKKGKKYHYYITNSYRQTEAEPCLVRRIPAGEIEAVVAANLQKVFKHPQILIKTWKNIKEDKQNLTEQDLHEQLHKLHPIWEKLFPAEKARIARLLINRVTVHPTSIDIQYRQNGIEEIFAELQDGK